MLSKSQAKANEKYQKANTKLMSIRLNLKLDADIIEKLESVESKQGYIKRLIREDIAKQ